MSNNPEFLYFNESRGHIISKLLIIKKSFIRINIKRIRIYQLWNFDNLGHYLHREVKYNRPSNFLQEEDNLLTESFLFNN